jgi:hypothetical protein
VNFVNPLFAVTASRRNEYDYENDNEEREDIIIVIIISHIREDIISLLEHMPSLWINTP